MILGLFHQCIFLHCPLLSLRESTGVAFKHLGCYFVALELPVEPCEGRYRKFASMSLAVCASVADRVVGCKGRDVVDAVEVVHAVLVCYVCFASEDVYYRTVDVFQLVFLRHWHAWHGCGGIGEEAAVAYHQCGDALVAAVVERLESTA